MIVDSKNQNVQICQGVARWRLAFLFLLALTSGLLLAGCSSSLQQTLVGKWRGPCDFSTSSIAFQQVEFLPNGTYIQDGYVGSYAILNSQRIEIQFGSFGVALTASFPSDNTLVLTDNSGTFCTLTRELAASIENDSLARRKQITLSMLAIPTLRARSLSLWMKPLTIPVASFRSGES